MCCSDAGCTDNGNYIDADDAMITDQPVQQVLEILIWDCFICSCFSDAWLSNRLVDYVWHFCLCAFAMKADDQTSGADEDGTLTAVNAMITYQLDQQVRTRIVKLGLLYFFVLVSVMHD